MRHLLLFTIGCLACTIFVQAQDAKVGAFIMVSQQGDVSFLKADGSSAQAVPAGKPIPLSHTIITGKGSKLVGLLSNGTLLTLEEDTRMKVASFKQEPFEAEGKKLTDLKGEPSNSDVLVDLDFGSLVVKTKKLNKGSAFNINSPVGTAGIRGTEFQMASRPGQGVQLDVTESTVAFTPPGGVPLPVSQGNGLSVSPTGVPKMRPVNPTVARKIETTNQSATEATQEVSLGEVVVAMEQSAQEVEAVEDAPAQDTPEEEPAAEETEAEMESEEPASQEEAPAEESAPVEEAPVEVESEESAPVNEPAAPAEPEKTEDAAPAAPKKAEAKKANKKEAPGKGKPKKGAEPGDAGSSPKNPKSANTPAKPENTPAAPAQPAAPQVASPSQGNLPDVTRIVQDSDPEILQERELKKHQLSDGQKAKFDVLSSNTQAMVKELESKVVQRLTSVQSIGEEETVAFLNLSEQARELVLGLEDSVMTTLLQQNIDEELLVESLTKLNMSFPTPSDVPDFQPVFADDAPLQELSTKLRENGNSWVMDELFELSGGDLTEEWIEKGEIALLLLEDYRLDEITPVQALAAQKALNNPFYLEISALFEELALDELVSGEGTLIGGHNLIITENAQAMQPYFGDGVEEVILSATEDIRIEANFEWEAPLETSNARLVLMSGNDLHVAEGVSLRSATSDLVIASRNRLSLKDVKLYGAREVSLRGMRDVSLDNVEIEASTLAKIKARRDLDVNGLSFRQDISKIVMEATTLRLKNVNFPGSAQVRLNSSLGGVDGRYPNFGTVSPNQQIGRVNFIENVKSGGNLLNTRAAFDQHGGNIKIGRITNP